MDKITQTIIAIEQESTWPEIVSTYLDENLSTLEKWASKTANSDYNDNLIAAYDNIVYGLKVKLDKCALLGYHCTKLVDWEIDEIKANGMSLPNPESLTKRIRKLTASGLIESGIAEQLLVSNAANTPSRKNRIWFCFFEPKIEESGVERFFRYWGGEALYIMHEETPVMAKILEKIGTPCIIEALVPLAAFDGRSFELNIVRRYMINRNLERGSIMNYEGCIKINLPAQNIVEVIKFSDARFHQLAKQI